MLYYCAPMEGVTGWLYRSLHHRYFGGVDRYYMPFWSPNSQHRLSRKELADVLPERNEGVPAVPQVMTKNAADFLWAAETLADMGYDEINLNLGCPSGTVVAKGKGAGMLRDAAALDRFFDAVFAACPLRVSVKTRLGLQQAEEFDALLHVFERYPIAELILHPRVQQDFYKKPVHTAAFDRAAKETALSLCYNGDLFWRAAIEQTVTAYPQLHAIMLGRGLIRNPALLTDTPPMRQTLLTFHEALFDGYCEAFRSPRNAMLRMKEIWFYMITLFEQADKPAKQLRKTTDPSQFSRLAEQIILQMPFRAENSAVVF